MTDVASTLVKHRRRLNEIVSVLVRHGLASWAARGQGIPAVAPIESIVHRAVSPEEAEATPGERLRHALTELGTTFIKFGQMLSLRPDIVGDDVAKELAKLQARVPADPPGVGRATVEAQLGRPVSELFGSFEDEPFASGSVAQVHRAALVRWHRPGRESSPRGGRQQGAGGRRAVASPRRVHGRRGPGAGPTTPYGRRE